MVKAAIIQLDRHARGVHQEHLKQVQGGHGLLMEGYAQRLASPAPARPIGCQKCDVIYRSASVEFFNRPLSEVVAQSFGRAGIHSDQMHDSKLRLLIVGVQPNSREIERWTKADAKLQHVAVEAPRAVEIRRADAVVGWSQDGHVLFLAVRYDADSIVTFRCVENQPRHRY